MSRQRTDDSTPTDDILPVTSNEENPIDDMEAPVGSDYQSTSDVRRETSDSEVTDTPTGPTRDPLFHPNYGCRKLNTRVASEKYADVLPNRYLFDGTVISWGGAVEQYRNERRGQDASAEANGWGQTLHQRARRKCAVLHHADRTIRPEMGNPTLSFLTFAGQYDPTRDNEFAHIIDYTDELTRAVDASMSTHRYQIRREYQTEYGLIMGGTETGIPHFHMVGWHDGSVERDGFEAVIERFVDECAVTTEVQCPPEEAVKLDSDPNNGLEEYPGDPRREPVHPFARDAANQLPHLGRVDDDIDVFEGMTQGELRFSAVADALPSSVSTWRASRDIPSIDSLSG